MNTLFHAGATLWFRSYSPGLVTSVLLYPAFFIIACRLALSEGLLTFGLLIWAGFIAAFVHAVDVSSSVFFKTLDWPKRAMQKRKRNYVEP